MFSCPINFHPRISFHQVFPSAFQFALVNINPPNVHNPRLEKRLAFPASDGQLENSPNIKLSIGHNSRSGQIVGFDLRWVCLGAAGQAWNSDLWDVVPRDEGGVGLVVRVTGWAIRYTIFRVRNSICAVHWSTGYPRRSRARGNYFGIRVFEMNYTRGHSNW